MASTEPHCTVAMVAQLIAGIGMHEDVERSMIERKPTDDLGKPRRRKRDLATPPGMGPHRSLMKTTDFDVAAKTPANHVEKFPGRIG